MVTAQAVDSFVVISRFLGIEIDQDPRRRLGRHDAFAVSHAEDVSRVIEKLIMRGQNRVVLHQN